MSSSIPSSRATPGDAHRRKPAPRHSGIDLLRVVAIMAVVLGHLPLEPGMRATIYGWHVPLFFFLSGWFYRPGRTVEDEVTNRWRTIGRPYVFWLLVIGSVEVSALLIRDEFSPVALARMAWGGALLVSPFSAFWFMSALFFGAVLYRVLADRLTPEAALLVGILAMACAGWVGEPAAKLPLALGQAAMSLVFLYAGHRAAGITRPGRVTGAAAVAVVISGACALWTGLVPPLDMKVADMGAPIVSVLLALVMSWGLTAAAASLPSLGRGADSVVTELAATGTAVIFLHALFIWGTVRWEVPTPVAFPIMVVLCWAVALVLAKAPASEWTLGRPRRTRG